MLYLLPAVRWETTFNEDQSWCPEHANYLQQPTNIKQDYDYYNMDE